MVLAVIAGLPPSLNLESSLKTQFSNFVGNVTHNFPLAQLVGKQMQDMGSAGGYEVIGGEGGTGVGDEGGLSSISIFPKPRWEKGGVAPSRNEWWERMGHDGLIQQTALEKWHHPAPCQAVATFPLSAHTSRSYISTAKIHP